MTGKRVTVTAVRSVEIAMADPISAADFFTNVWNLSTVGTKGETIYLRGSSAFHHIISLTPSFGAPRIRRVVLDAASPEIVDALYEKVKVAGIPREAPHLLDELGSGYGFGFEDPQGRALAIVTGKADHPDGSYAPDIPHKIAHVNFNDPEPDVTRDFYVETLGFRFVDHAGAQYFMNCDSPDHSSVVICRAAAATLNHLSFEMKDLDAVMRGAGRMRDAGYPIEWGVGRHGCANNCFAYFAGPEEIPLEYTSDVLQIDETYPFNGPEYWAWQGNRRDQWGVTEPQTNRWKRIQSLVRFERDAFSLRGREVANAVD